MKKENSSFPPTSMRLASFGMAWLLYRLETSGATSTLKVILLLNLSMTMLGSFLSDLLQWKWESIGATSIAKGELSSLRVLRSHGRSWIQATAEDRQLVSRLRVNGE